MTDMRTQPRSKSVKTKRVLDFQIVPFGHFITSDFPHFGVSILVLALEQLINGLRPVRSLITSSRRRRQRGSKNRAPAQVQRDAARLSWVGLVHRPAQTGGFLKPIEQCINTAFGHLNLPRVTQYDGF
jgi:hypothetical protein